MFYLFKRKSNTCSNCIYCNTEKCIYKEIIGVVYKSHIDRSTELLIRKCRDFKRGDKKQ